jgi:hypothetical protein
MNGQKNRGGFRPVDLLLIVPFIAQLWVPFYNNPLPTLAGIPFFYWYQLLWVPLTAAILAIAYFVDERS